MAKFLDNIGLTRLISKIKLGLESKQDVLTVGDGIAIDNNDTIRTTGIPFGRCDSTSTNTAFTVTVPGIYKLEDGVCCLVKNGVVTSASGFTLNVNGLGAKPCYSNMAAATAETTLFNVNYTILFIYDSTRATGGCWIYYRGYYSTDGNSIGYQLRGNSSVLPVSDTARYYKLYFTSADGTKWVPASVNSTNNATSARPVNQRPIDPFGQIVYTSASTKYSAGANLAASTAWSQYVFNLGYSFNRTGVALELTFPAPVYIKCAPQADGSAIIDADTPYVQTLPSTNDGKIYIYLGLAYNATNIELFNNHPVYYHDGTGIRLWTGKDCLQKVLIETTYLDLITSRDNKTLIPGAKYRITDYQCTTTQENTQSAGHQFDVVLHALSKDKLAEEGWAMMHDNIYDVTFADGITKKCYYNWDNFYDNVFVDVETLLGMSGISDSDITINEETKTINVELDTEEAPLTSPDLPYNYFQNSNLSAWKVWYCLDNNKTRFGWADDSVDEDMSASISIEERDDEVYIYTRKQKDDIVVSDIQYYAWEGDENYRFPEVYTTSETPEVRDSARYYENGGMSVFADVVSYTPAHEGTGLPNGRGVIYRLIDEWGNDCPYDFKNIMFKRKLTNGQLDATNGSDTWVYTFNAIIGNGAATDNSLGLNLSLLGGSGIITLCADNIIKPCYDYKNINNVIGGSGEYVLNDTVFLGYAATVADVANLYTTGNEFGVCARDNTFGYLTRSNKFGVFFENNTFGFYCYGNRIENGFTENQVLNSFNGNIIGNECQYNTFGSYSEYNTIGNNCQYNTFSTNNMVIDGEDSMVTNNIFGNNVSHCTFSSIGSCSIGNFVRWVVMDDHKYSKFAIKNNVSYVRFTCSASQTYDHICQNFKICEGVQGTSSSSLKTITHTTVDDTFLTEYKPANSQTIYI